MIVYDLECRAGCHRFEGWFKSSDDFLRQREMGRVTCPFCASDDVDKAVQAPRLGRKGNQSSEPVKRDQDPEPQRQAPPAALSSASLSPQAVEMMKKLAQMQREALKASRYVGDSFVEDVRAIHYGDRAAEAIHGQTTASEARELIEEGISIMPLPFPVLPPEQTN